MKLLVPKCILIDIELQMQWVWSFHLISSYVISEQKKKETLEGIKQFSILCLETE